MRKSICLKTLCCSCVRPRESPPPPKKKGEGGNKLSMLNRWISGNDSKQKRPGFFSSYYCFGKYQKEGDSRALLRVHLHSTTHRDQQTYACGSYKTLFKKMIFHIIIKKPTFPYVSFRNMEVILVAGFFGAVFEGILVGCFFL